MLPANSSLTPQNPLTCIPLASSSFIFISRFWEAFSDLVARDGRWLMAQCFLNQDQRLSLVYYLLFLFYPLCYAILKCLVGGNCRASVVLISVC
jgi:hypothetical protein